MKKNTFIRTFTLLSLMLGLTFLSLAQPAFHSWSFGIGASDGDRGYGVAIDDDGNIYNAGMFKQTVDFDPSSSNANLTSAGNFDIFISKYTSDGDFIWAKRIGGSEYDLAYDMALDHSGNILITGFFVGTVDFDPGSGTANSTAIQSDQDVYVLKLDKDGDYIWHKHIDAYFSNQIIIGPENEIYVGGTITNTTDFDPSSNTDYLYSGDRAAYMWKLDSTGTHQWVKGFHGSNSYDEGTGVHIDHSGNLYMTGFFSNVIDCDPGSGTTNLTSVGNFDVFVVKLDYNGDFEWGKSFGGSTYDRGRGVVVDQDKGVYVSGFYQGTADFDPGSGTTSIQSNGGYDNFLMKLDSNGNFKWATNIGGNGPEDNWDLDLDINGDIVLTGGFSSKTDFDPSSDTFFLESFGNYDAFIASYSQSGDLNWAKQMGGTSEDMGFELVIGNGQGHMAITGRYTSTNADFDPDSTTNLISSNGGRDIFLVRLNRCFTDTTIYLIGCDSVVSPSGNYVYYETGIYTDTLVSGCGGKLVEVRATIPVDTAGGISVYQCEPFYAPSGKYIWTQSGVYYDTLINGSYCGKDSITKYFLTIYTPNSRVLDVDACASYTSPSGNYTWTSSGTYYDTIPDPSLLCDSFLTINLVINQSFETVNVSACNEYISPSGDYTWTTSGTYSDTIPNVNNCDSIITINLTVNTTTYANTSVEVCNEFVSPSGKYTWTTSTIKNDTIPNSNGCDSVITFSVTLLKSYGGTSISGCTPYVSPSGNQIWTSTGKYFDTLVNHLDCDSILVVNFTEQENPTATITRNSCNLYASPSGKMWTQSGTYHDTIPNAECDSIVTINLTINVLSTKVTANFDTLTAVETNADYKWLNCEANFEELIDETGQQFIASADGEYAVEVSTQQCTDTSECFIVMNVGVEDALFFNNLKLYPNPTSGKVTLEFDKLYPEISVKVLNSYGQELAVLEESNTAHFQFKIEQPAGIYYLLIVADKKTANYKLIKYD